MTRIVRRAAMVLLLACTPRQKPVEPSSASRPSVPEGWSSKGDDFVLGGEPAPIDTAGCNPFLTPPERRGGDLIVRAPPDRVEQRFRGRLRDHIEGALSRGSPRTWVGPQVPGFVPLTEGTQELLLLDSIDEDFLALYRDPYGASTCTLDRDTNCGFTVRFFAHCGDEKWTVRINDFMSRPTYLELQDVRYVDGVLYFNEACQSYARQVRGRCSALVAVDPVASRLLWRTKPLVSNGTFLVHGDHVVTGYGFAKEANNVFVVRRRDGKIVQKKPVRGAPQEILLAGDAAIDVILAPGDKVRRFRLASWNTAEPRLLE